MAVDVERILAAAFDAYLRDGSSGGRDADAPRDRSGRRRGGARAVAVGMALGAGAHVAYRRLRRVDLTQVAGAVQRRLLD